MTGDPAGPFHAIRLAAPMVARGLLHPEDALAPALAEARRIAPARSVRGLRMRLAHALHDAVDAVLRTRDATLRAIRRAVRTLDAIGAARAEIEAAVNREAAPAVACQILSHHEAQLEMLTTVRAIALRPAPRRT